MGLDSFLIKQGVDPWMARQRLKQLWNKWGWRLGRGAACTGAALFYGLLFVTPVGERSELLLRRLWYGIRGERAVTAPVMMARIDDAAYTRVNKAGVETFPREVLAEAVVRIADAGARMIFLDFILRKETTPEADDKLRQALAHAPSVIGRTLQYKLETGPDGERIARRVELKPRRPFQDAAKMTASLHVVVSHGVVEKISLGPDDTLSDKSLVPLLGPLRTLVSPELEAPGWRDLINYYGGPFTIPSIGLMDVLDADEDELVRYFKDRAVFVGITTQLGSGQGGSNDTFNVPVSGTRMFGVEIHATIAANLLDGTWLRRSGPAVEVVVGALLSFLLAFALLTLRPIRAVGVLGLVSTAWLLMSYMLFFKVYYFIPGALLIVIVVPALIALRLGVPAVIARSSRSRPKNRGGW